AETRNPIGTSTGWRCRWTTAASRRSPSTTPASWPARGASARTTFASCWSAALGGTSCAAASIFRRVRLALALPALALSMAAAQAALPDEIPVYNDDLEAPGERGIELHVNTTPSGRTAPDYPGEVVPHHGLRITPEISYGLARDWDGGISLPVVRSGDGSWFFAGPKFRLKWLPLRPDQGAVGVFSGVNAELAFVQERFEQSGRSAEIRPIIGYRGERWLFSFNPILETDLAGEQKGV